MKCGKQYKLNDLVIPPVLSYCTRCTPKLVATINEYVIVPIFSQSFSKDRGNPKDYIYRFLGIALHALASENRAKVRFFKECAAIMQNKLYTVGIIGENGVNLQGFLKGEKTANLYYVGRNPITCDNRSSNTKREALFHVVAPGNLFYINAVLFFVSFPATLFRVLIDYLKTYELPIYFRVDFKKTRYFDTHIKKSSFFNLLVMLNFIQYVPPFEDDVQHYFWFPEIEKARRDLIDYIIEAATLT